MSSICTHTHTFVIVISLGSFLIVVRAMVFHFGFLTWSFRLCWSEEVWRLSTSVSVGGHQGSSNHQSRYQVAEVGRFVRFVQAGGRYMGFLLLRLICRADSTGSHKVSGRVGAPSCLQRGGALLAGNGGVGSWWPLTACSSFSNTATLRSKVAVVASEIGTKCLL